MIIPIRKITTTPPIAPAVEHARRWRATTTHEDGQREHHDPGQHAGPEHQAADHHRDDQRGERHDRDGVLRHADQHGRGHEQQRRDEVGLAQAADRPVPATREHPAGRRAGRRRGAGRDVVRPWWVAARHGRSIGRDGRDGSRPCSRTARDRNVGWQRGHQNRLRPSQHLGADRGAADEARLAVRGGRRRPRRRGRRRAAPGPSPPACGRRARCRSGRSARRRPSARRGRPTSLELARAAGVLPGRSGCDPVPEQHLGAVDVADAGQHRLVHQQAADRGRGCGCIRAQARVRVGVRRAAGRARAGRRSASRCSRGRSARRRWRRAGRRTPAGARRCRRRPAAAGPGRPGGLGDAVVDVELAVEPEVHVHAAVAGRSRRTGACPQDSARLQHACRRAARRTRANRPCGLLDRTPPGRRRRRRACVGEPVEGVALRHLRSGRAGARAPTPAAAGGRRSSRSRRASRSGARAAPRR